VWICLISNSGSSISRSEEGVVVVKVKVEVVAEVEIPTQILCLHHQHSLYAEMNWHSRGNRRYILLRQVGEPSVRI